MEKIKLVLADVFQIKSEDINDETSMQSVDRWDSINHMLMIMELETAFDIHFESEEIIEMTSFAKISEIIKSKIN